MTKFSSALAFKKWLIPALQVSCSQLTLSLENRNEIMIEGNFGLGETVVSGAVNPDDFVVDKKTMTIKESRIAKKTIKYIRDPKTGKTIHLDIPDDKQKVVCVSDEEIMKLAELAKTNRERIMVNQWILNGQLIKTCLFQITCSLFKLAQKQFGVRNLWKTQAE